MRKTLLVTLCLCSFLAYGDELNTLFDKGATYYKAGEMEKAIKSFQEAHKKAPAGIKKDIISYNLATSYLKNQQCEKAAALFNEVYENKERLPQHLFDRCAFNFMVTQLDQVNHTLKDDAEPLTIECLEDAKKSLELAHQIYQHVLSSKEGHTLSQQEAYMELAIKGLKSKLYDKIQETTLEKLTFETAIAKLQEQMGKQIAHYERIGGKKLGESLTRYFLNQQYVKEQKERAVWKRLEALIDDQITQLQSDRAADSKRVLEKKSVKKQFLDSYNDYLASLDCMRENQLWLGRLKGARSKLSLDLIDLHLRGQDPIKYCLQKRIDIVNRQQEVDITAPFIGSLHRELKCANATSAALMEQFKEALLQSDLKVEKAHIALLAEKLKRNIKRPYTSFSVHSDYYLYEQMSGEPIDILYPIYSSLKQLEKQPKASLYQLHAAYDFFETQKDVASGEDNKRKIERSFQSIGTAFKAYEASDYAMCSLHLEDFFLHFNFGQFMLKEVRTLSLNLENILHSPHLNTLRIQELADQLHHANESRTSADLSIDDFAIRKAIEPGFNGAIESMSLQKRAEEAISQRMLLENTQMWMKRLDHTLEEKELSSLQILENGIEEQKLALSFSSEYPKLSIVDSAFENAFLTMTIDLENHPINAVGLFESVYSKEKEQPKNDKTISSFREGLKWAHLAQKKLLTQSIDWSKISMMQNKVLECWQEAFLSYQNSSDESSNGNSTQSSTGEENNEAEGDLKNVSEIADASQENEKNSSDQARRAIMGILEKLNEMQQDDKIAEKDPTKPKEGLRPW